MKFTMINTPRLNMVACDKQHYDDFLRLYSNPKIMQYIPGGVRSPKQMEQELDNFRFNWYTKGLAPFAVFHHATGMFVGRSGLYFDPSRSPNPQLGYMISPEFQGQGLATECAQYSFYYGFEIRNFSRVDAFTQKQNVVSCKILNKFMYLESEFISDDGFEYCKYSISAFEYQQMKQFNRFLVIA